MNRYTVSRHETREGTHYDLFLESGDILKTWRLDRPPEDNPSQVEPIGDHRKAYLDYEGPVSGDRGRVTIHAAGNYSLDAGVLELTGGKSAGSYQFQGGILRSINGSSA